MNTASAKKPAKWLIAYLVYDSSYYEEIMQFETNGHLPPGYKPMKEQTNSLFHTIADLPFNDQITVLIFHFSCIFKPGDTKLRVIEKKSDGSDVLDIVTNEKIQGVATASKPGPQVNAETFANTDSIVAMFNYIKNNYLYEKLMVITFGHGCLFGINLTSHKLYQRLLDLQIGDAKPQPSPETDSPEKSFTLNETYRKVFEGMQQDILSSLLSSPLAKKLENMHMLFNTEGKRPSKRERSEMNRMIDDVMKMSILTNRELQEGIRLSLEGNKVDVLVMYNCLMQNIYAQYELRNSVDFLVAPVGGIGFPGYDIASVYNIIAASTEILPQAVAEAFLTPLHYNSPFYNGFQEKLKSSWFIAVTPLNAVLLQTTQAAYTVWTDLIAHTLTLNSKVNDALSTILMQTALQACNLSNNCIADLKVIDFFVYLSELIQKIEITNRLPPDTKQTISAITQILLGYVKQLAGEMKFYLGNDFYGTPNVEYYTDQKYTEGRGIGIILALSDKLHFEIINMIFGGAFEGDRVEGIVPSFLEDTKTQELVAAAKFPY